MIAAQAIVSGHKQASIEMGPHPTPGLWRAEVTQGPGKTTFRFLVLGEIPAHPRLLLSKWRLDQLSHDARYAEIRRQIHRRAMALASQITYNPAAGDNIELMPSGPGIKPAAAGQLSPYVELVNAYSDAIAYNALDYRLNSDAASLAAARRALHALVQWHAWVPPRFRSHGLETYYQVGVMVQQVALGYDLIADQLSPQEREDVAQAFWEKVIQPTVQEYFLYNRDPIGASNWMANSVGGALAAAVAVAGDVPEWNQREAPAVAQLQFAFEQLLGGLFPGDGSEAEPTGYENFAMQGVSWGMTALAALDIRPRGTDQMLAGFWWPYYDTVRPGMELDTGDFDGHLKGLSGFAWSAEHAGIPELRALYDGGTQLDLSRGATTDRNGHLLEEMLGPLDLACCSEPARAFKAPPPSRVFPGRGSAVLRSGWEPDATVVSIRVGPWFNHEHSDEGSFQVAAFGEKLIDEAGYANYYTDPNYPDYFTQAAGHNTLLVDRDPFSQAAFNGRYWSGFEYPHFSAWLLGTSFDYLSADLTAAYDGRVPSYQREFVFLKPGVLVVCDRVRAASPHVFSWPLHTPAGSKLATVGTHASIQTVHAYASLTAAGPNTIWTTALTPIALEAFKDLDRQHIELLRELVLSSAKVTATQFIVAIKLGKGTTSPQPEMESWREASGEGLRAISGSPTSIIFRTGNGPLRIASVATDGSVLAWLGGDSSWLAIGARSVEDNKQVLLRATAPTDLTWERSPSGLELSLHNGTPDTIQVFNAVAPVSVDIDGQRVSASYMDGMVTLQALEAGEHHVSIR